MANFILDSEKKVKDKLDMLQALTDMKITTKILDGQDFSSDIDIVDQNYQKNSNVKLSICLKIIKNMILYYNTSTTPKEAIT